MAHDTPAGTCGASGVEIGWCTPILFGGFPLVACGLFITWLIMLFRPTAKTSKAKVGDAPVASAGVVPQNSQTDRLGTGASTSNG